MKLADIEFLPVRGHAPESRVQGKVNLRNNVLLSILISRDGSLYQDKNTDFPVEVAAIHSARGEIVSIDRLSLAQLGDYLSPLTAV